MDPDDFAARRNMLEYDPPEHTRYRRLVSKPFSRREVYAYEGAIRLLARAVLDEALPPGGTATLDFVESIAKQLPMRMLGRLLGVPDSDGPWLVERGDALLGNFDPEFTDHPVGLDRHRRVQGDPVPLARRARPVPLRRGAGRGSGGRTRPTT